MADEIDDKIAKLVQSAMESPQQRKANAAAAEALRQAAERERAELERKWHADQTVLAGLAQKATAIAAGPFVGFAYRSEPPAETQQLGSGRFIADCRDGSQATLFLDAWASGTITLGYTAVDPATLARDLPLLAANEEAYAGAVVAFLTLVQKAKLGG